MLFFPWKGAFFQCFFFFIKVHYDPCKRKRQYLLFLVSDTMENSLNLFSLYLLQRELSVSQWSFNNVSEIITLEMSYVLYWDRQIPEVLIWWTSAGESCRPDFVRFYSHSSIAGSILCDITSVCTQSTAELSIGYGEQALSHYTFPHVFLLQVTAYIGTTYIAALP